MSKFAGLAVIVFAMAVIYGIQAFPNIGDEIQRTFAETGKNVARLCGSLACDESNAFITWECCDGFRCCSSLTTLSIILIVAAAVLVVIFVCCVVCCCMCLGGNRRARL